MGTPSGCSLAPVQSSMSISVYAKTFVARMPGTAEASSKTTKGVRSTVTWQHTHSSPMNDEYHLSLLLVIFRLHYRHIQGDR
jgi:hypothetical protein